MALRYRPGLATIANPPAACAARLLKYHERLLLFFIGFFVFQQFGFQIAGGIAGRVLVKLSKGVQTKTPWFFLCKRSCRF
jgi:hypothetical protein